MAGYATYSLGLTIKQPRKGTKGFFLTMENDTYKKISAHDHSASGNGVQINTNGLAAACVTNAKMGVTWATYSPTIAKISGTGTLGAPSGVVSRTLPMGKLQFFAVKFTTVITVNSVGISVTLPVAASALVGSLALNYFPHLGNPLIGSADFIDVNTVELRTSSGNPLFSVDTVDFLLSGFYEIP